MHGNTHIRRMLVDGDSCPRDRRSLIAQRAASLAEPPRFYIHRAMHVDIPACNVISCVDSDRSILQDVEHHDMVITRDLLLAEKLIGRAAAVIDFCGRLLQDMRLADRIAGRRELLYGYGSASGGRISRAQCRHQFTITLDRLLGSGSSTGA